MDYNTVLNNNKVTFNNLMGYQVELTVIEEGSYIKIYNEAEDITEQLTGMTSVYGSLSNLVQIHNMLLARTKLF